MKVGVNEVLCGKRLLAIGLSYAGLAGPGPDSEKKPQVPATHLQRWQ